MNKRLVRIVELLLAGLSVFLLLSVAGCGTRVSQKDCDLLAIELARSGQELANLKAQLDIPAFQGLSSVTLKDGIFHLSWIAASDDDTEQPFIRYDVFESNRPGLENYDFSCPIASVIGATSIRLSGLDTTRPHYFIVRAADQDGTCDRNTIEQAYRILSLSGAANFRDLGGYIRTSAKQVRWGLIYRSGDLAKLTDSDVARVQNLGLKTIVDLRRPTEIQRDGYDRTYAGSEDIYEFIPFNYGDPYLLQAEKEFPLSWDLRRVDFPDWYINMLEANKDGIKEVFSLYTDPDQYPILVHCSQGKDRAGLVSALLLLLLDVPRTTVIEDYMLSCELIDVLERLREIEGYVELFQTAVPEGVTIVDWIPLVSCVPDSIRNPLDYLDAQYSGVGGFLDSIGISSGEQQTIRELLLQD